MPHSPLAVLPSGVARALADLEHWFVIGGNAIRCLMPYRPTRDVDLGVPDSASLKDVLQALQHRGAVEILEHATDTIHLRFEGVPVSLFVLEPLVAHVEDRRLTITGILATKLHAILDRGARRDFFDLYAVLHHEHLGIAESIAALGRVYHQQQEVPVPLLLRALSWFDDADREAQLPGEGAHDWAIVKRYFLEQVGDLLLPPRRGLDILRHTVDVER